VNNKLDATGFDQRGPELVDKIAAAVARTQRYFQSELPNTLQITQEQFDSLMTVEQKTSYMAAVNMGDMYPGLTKKAYIFYTPLNAMDVDVVDQPRSNLLIV
jgi:hypothetical protein